MKEVVGFSGAAESGKTTAASMLVDIAQPTRHSHIEFSDPIIEIGKLLTDGSVTDESELVDKFYIELQSLQPDTLLQRIDGLRLPDDYASNLFNRELGVLSVETKQQHRPILEWIGRSAIRLVSPQIWGDIVYTNVLQKQETGSDLITIGGVRTVADNQVIQNLHGYTVRVLRGENTATRLDTEHELNSWNADFTVRNDGSLDDLHNSVHDIWFKIV